MNSAKSYRKAIQLKTFEHLFLAGDIIKEAPKQSNKKVAALQFLMLSFSSVAQGISISKPKNNHDNFSVFNKLFSMNYIHDLFCMNLNLFHRIC